MSCGRQLNEEECSLKRDVVRYNVGVLYRTLLRTDAEAEIAVRPIAKASHIILSYSVGQNAPFYSLHPFIRTARCCSVPRFFVSVVIVT